MTRPLTFKATVLVCTQCKMEWMWCDPSPGPDICPNCEIAKHEHELARAMDEG